MCKWTCIIKSLNYIYSGTWTYYYNIMPPTLSIKCYLDGWYFFFNLCSDGFVNIYRSIKVSSQSYRSYSIV